MQKPLPEHLVLQCRSGDRQAYAVLAERYAGEIYAICLAILRNEHDAEDATQEVLVKCFVRIRQLHDPKKFEPWIKRMARNHCRDVLRQKKRHREKTAERPVRNQEPDTRLSGLAQAIQALPSKHRRVIHLRYFEGRPCKEVAQQLKLSVQSVNTRLFRARKLLFEKYTQRGGAW